MQHAIYRICSSDSLFQKYDGVAEMRAPHGNHNISEFVHTLIGAATGEHLLAPFSDARAEEQPSTVADR